MSRNGYAILLLMCCVSTVVADDEAVYESIADIAIGRVFMSPQQRQQLDVRRLHPDRYAGAGTPREAGQQETKHRSPPAGYISSSSGGSRYWNNGDFVAGNSRNSTSMSFPGDVAIVRHAAPEAAEQGPPGKIAATRQSTADPDAPADSGAEGEAGADEK